MAVGSNVNPNYPIPGLDQSSKGFRDNFSTIKREIEDLQSTTIQLVGGCISDPVQIGSGGASLVINTAVDGSVIALPAPANGIQYNHNGRLTGNPEFTYNQDTGTVGIGIASPDLTTSIDAAGAIHVGGNVVISSTSVDGYSNIVMATSGMTASIVNDTASLTIATDVACPISITSGGDPSLIIAGNGNVGLGTNDPQSALHVVSNGGDVSRFTADQSNTDNVIRASVNAFNSTIGLALEHRFGNTLGGIRIDEAGMLSLHSGESMDADLSTSTARITIDRVGKVGIGVLDPNYDVEINGTFKTVSILDNSIGADRLVGINQSDPQYTLDVGGDIALTGGIYADPSPLTIDTAPVLIDTWYIREIRSARYTIQVSHGNPPLESVDIIDYVVTYANEAPFANVNSIFSTGSALGTLSVQLVDEWMSVYYNGNAAGNRVKLSKTYITI